MQIKLLKLKDINKCIYILQKNINDFNYLNTLGWAEKQIKLLEDSLNKLNKSGNLSE